MKRNHVNVTYRSRNPQAVGYTEARGTTLTEAVTRALEASLEREADVGSPELLLAEVAKVQAFVADLPDRDCRDPDEILGYDDRGLPA